ncbi:MAG: hypothetical protein RIC55_05830 [Pirellulaceae bacterium]
MSTAAPRVGFQDKLPVVVASFAIFALLGRGTLMTSDEGGIFNTGVALARGTLVVGPGENNFPGADRQYYSVKEILPCVLVVPTVVAGVVAERMLGLVDQPPVAAGPDVAIAGLDMSTNWPVFLVSWFWGPLAIALTLGGLHEYLLLENVTRRRALLMTLAAGLATPLLVYSKTIFPQTFEAAILMACFVVARRWRERPTLAMALWLGIGAALGLMTRWAFAPVVLLLAGYLALVGDIRRPRRLAAIAIFLAPLMLAILIVGAVNHLKWGAWYELGRGDHEVFSTNLFVGLAGLLVSPGKSIFLYAPLCLLPLLFARRVFRSLRPEAILLLLVTAVYLVVYSQWYDWYGGLCWGPRFLVPLIAPWLMLLAPLLSAPPSRRFQIAFVCAVVAGVAVQLVGISVHPFWMKTVPDVDPFSPFNSHLVHTVLFVVRHGADDFWLPAALRSASPMGLRLMLVSVACLAFAVWRLRREFTTAAFSKAISTQS